MDSLALRPEDARHLASTATKLATAARELVSFSMQEPALANQASLEVIALEAKAILEGGAVARVVAAARSPRPSLRRADLDAVDRLEAISSISAARLEGLENALSDEGTDAPLERLGSVMGLAATTLGLIKTVF